jgi:hypothetical protein
MTSIFIATPTTGGIVKASYSASKSALIATLERSGVRTRFGHFDGIGIAEQRDVLAASALTTDCTHVLFIDSDMAFPPDLAARFLSHKKPLVGAIYTRRRLDLARLRQELRVANGDFDRAMANAYDFNIRAKGPLTGQGALCKLDGLGMGFTLIRREVFTAMSNKLALRQYASRHVPSRVSGFFDEIPMPDGSRLSEDFSFCQRWQDCGGEVWGDAEQLVSHIGDFSFGVPFIHRLR